MDMEKGKMLTEALDRCVGSSTIYEVQERSVNGEFWYSMGCYNTLDDAAACRQRHFEKWYSRAFDSVDDVVSLRIVMRHTVEVVL